MPDDPLVSLIAPSLLQRLAGSQPLATGMLASGPGSVVYGTFGGVDALAARLIACGRAGEDALRRMLDRLFGALNTVVEEHGGGVVHFGDATFVAALRPAGPYAPGRAADDVEHAFACALALQARLASFLAIEGPIISSQLQGSGNGTPLVAPLRLGVGAGTHTEVCAGEPVKGRQYFVAGAALDEAIAAHAMARPGEVIAGSTALGLALGMAELGLRTQFGLVAGTPSLEALGGQSPAPLPAPAAAALSACLPAALRLRAARSDGLRGGTQRAAVLAVRWPAHAEPGVVQGHVAAAARLAAAGDGCIVEVLAGGAQPGMLLFFGVAAPEENAQAQALRCARTLRDAAPGISLAVAAGPVFAGAFGSERRRCFIAIGAPVLEARRLAAQAAPGLVWLAAPDAEHAQAFM
jgi:class 3 adenylate cyclase